MPTQAAPYGAMDDRDLVIAFKAGEPGAYDEMYRRYSTRVRSICRRMLANPDDAQEAVQETFLKAYVALPQFNGNYRLGAWLGRIASNACLDILRARARGATVVSLHPESEALGVETSAEEIVVGDAPELSQHIGEIQPLHARALVMRGVEGLSHREMAGRLSMTPAQVKALLHRARRSFKRTLDEAKGLALAPLLWLRGVTREARGASAAGGQIAGAAAGAGPLFADRVAASAMIVAVAFTGISGSAPTPAGATETPGHRPLQAIERTLSPEHTTLHVRLAREHGVPATRSTGGEPAAAAPLQQSAVPVLQKVLTKTRGTVRHTRHHHDSGDSSVVTSIPPDTHGPAKKAIKEIDKLIPSP